MDRRGDQARVLTNLGDAQLAFGDTQAAVAAWQQAVTIFDELQHPGAELARAASSATSAAAKPSAVPRRRMVSVS